MKERDEWSPFGKRLKEVFRFATNESIAERIGVGKGAVGFYVRGRLPPMDVVLKIQEVTGCNLHWLLTGEGPRTPPAEETVFDLEYSVEHQNDWLAVIDDWYEFEGRKNPMPDTLGASFMGGWAKMTKEERLNAIRDFKNFLDLTFPRNEDTTRKDQ
jgi:hypothetical protein